MIYNLIVGIDAYGHAIYDPIPPATEDEVVVFEKAIQSKLPKDYRDFLKSVNGGIIDPRQSDMVGFLAKKPGSQPLEWGFSNLYTLNENFKNKMQPPREMGGRKIDNEISFLHHWARLWAKKEWLGPDADFYYKHVPTDIIPIGSAGPAQILMGISGDRYGKIYVWNLRDDNWNEDAFNDPSKLLDPYEGIYFVADSFEEFFSSLKPVED